MITECQDRENDPLRWHDGRTDGRTGWRRNGVMIIWWKNGYTMNVQNGGGKEACITSYNSTSLRGRISERVSRNTFLIPVVCVLFSNFFDGKWRRIWIRYKKKEFRRKEKNDAKERQEPWIIETWMHHIRQRTQYTKTRECVSKNREENDGCPLTTYIHKRPLSRLDKMTPPPPPHWAELKMKKNCQNDQPEIITSLHKVGT